MKTVNVNDLGVSDEVMSTIMNQINESDADNTKDGIDSIIAAVRDVILDDHGNPPSKYEITLVIIALHMGQRIGLHAAEAVRIEMAKSCAHQMDEFVNRLREKYPEAADYMIDLIKQDTIALIMKQMGIRK
jgi:hypothetical protein